MSLMFSKRYWKNMEFNVFKEILEKYGFFSVEKIKGLIWSYVLTDHLTVEGPFKILADESIFDKACHL